MLYLFGYAHWCLATSISSISVTATVKSYPVYHSEALCLLPDLPNSSTDRQTDRQTGWVTGTGVDVYAALPGVLTCVTHDSLAGLVPVAEEYKQGSHLCVWPEKLRVECVQQT